MITCTHAGVILGYGLTNIDDFHCQYEDLHGATLQQMLHYVIKLLP